MGNQAREHTGIPSLQIVMPSTSITFKCKLSGSNDLRRRTVPLMDGTVAYATVLEMVTELFQLGGASFKLLWLDEDEDLVTIGTNADVDEAVRWALSASTTLRLEVKLTAPVPEAEQKAEQEPIMPIIPCPQCTFENSPESTQCEICEAVLHSQDGYLSSANCAVKGHTIGKRIHAHSKEESIANLVNRTAEMCSADSNAGGFTLNAPAGEVPWTVLKTKVGVTHHRREVDPEKQNKTLYTKV